MSDVEQRRRERDLEIARLMATGDITPETRQLYAAIQAKRGGVGAADIAARNIEEMVPGDQAFADTTLGEQEDPALVPIQQDPVQAQRQLENEAYLALMAAHKGSDAALPEAKPGGFHTPQVSPMEALLQEGRDLKQGALDATKTTRERLDKSQGELQEIYAQQSEELGAQQGQMDNALAEQAQQIANFEAHRVTLEEKQREASAKGMARIQAINDDIQNFKIDPNRAFRSTWQVVGAAIASAAGAYAQGISPNRIPNSAMAVINKAIERDILAQKMELGKLKSSADVENNIYARLLNQHGDEQRALAGARIAALTVVETKIKQLEANAKSTNQKLAIQATLQKIAYEKEVAIAGVDAKERSTAARLHIAEINAFARGAKGSGAGKKSTQERLEAVMPLFDQALSTFSVITAADVIAYKTYAGTKFGINTAGANRVKAYIQAKTILTKEIVSIFEGSKPSDLDWRTMIDLFPEESDTTEFGMGAIRDMKKSFEVRVAKLEPGEKVEKGWFANMAIEAGLTTREKLDAVSADDVVERKKSVGYEF